MKTYVEKNFGKDYLKQMNIQEVGVYYNVPIKDIYEDKRNEFDYEDLNDSVLLDKISIDSGYYVENFDRESGTVSESNTYALLYYVESEHDWSDTSTLFTQKEDGTYQCTYTANKTCNMSCSLYDKTNKVYKSLTASQGVDYDRGTTFNFTLSSMSSRGKSITVRSVPKGETLYINYTPSTENITVSCGAPKAEPNGDMTICEGTSRDTNIPYRSSSNNEETGTEQIYKSDMLTGLKDKKLCSMALYSSDEIEVDVKGMQIYLAEVDFSTMPNGWVDIPANAVKVFDGDYNFAGGKNIIEFKTPFEYKGGNLLVVIQNSAQGVCNEAKEFIGINTETTGVSCYRIGSSNASSASYDTNTSSFLAKCSFEFVDEHLYTVTWNNFDGTLLEKDENLTYGTTPTYDGETPIRQSDDEFTYTFSGWTPEVTKVTCDITYTAKFDKTPINDTDTTTDSEELSDTDTTTDSEELSYPILIQQQTVKNYPIQILQQTVKKYPIQILQQTAKRYPIRTQRQTAKRYPIRIQRQTAKSYPIRIQQQTAKSYPIRIQQQTAKRYPIRIQQQTAKRYPIQIQQQTAKRYPIQIQQQTVTQNPKQIHLPIVKQTVIQNLMLTVIQTAIFSPILIQTVILRKIQTSRPIQNQTKILTQKQIRIQI